MPLPGNVPGREAAQGTLQSRGEDPVCTGEWSTLVCGAPWVVELGSGSVDLDVVCPSRMCC